MDTESQDAKRLARKIDACARVAHGAVERFGERLHLSVKTVSTHKTRVLEKLNLKSTADLVRYAMEHRLV